MSQAFNITISVPSGNPDKLRLVEKTNRLSLGLVFHRDELAEVSRSRGELGYTGVYLLLNTSSDALPSLYIGEGENVLKRLKSHHKDSKKDFWEWTVVFVNRDNSLHKGHIQQLEAALVQRAKANKRCEIKNEQDPSNPSLPESMRYEADGLLIDIYQILPLLGISAFETIQRVEKTDSQTLHLRGKNVEASGYVVDGKFVVEAGSQVVETTVPSLGDRTIQRRNMLIDKGVVDASVSPWRFLEDYSFDSPSMASDTILGRSSNGRIEWKTAEGVTLKELQTAEIESG